MNEEKNTNGFGDYVGEIVDVGPEQTVGSNGFRKRDVVLDDRESKYPNPVKFTFKKDKCDLFAPYENCLGRRVRIRYVVNGRRWEGPRGVQYFVDLTALKIELVDEAKPEVPAPAQAPAAPAADPDNLPF